MVEPQESSQTSKPPTVSTSGTAQGGEREGRKVRERERAEEKERDGVRKRARGRGRGQEGERTVVDVAQLSDCLNPTTPQTNSVHCPPVCVECAGPARGGGKEAVTLRRQRLPDTKYR